MTVTVRPSIDGDRVWVDVDGAPRGFIRLTTLAGLEEVCGEWGPRELVPVDA